MVPQKRTVIAAVGALAAALAMTGCGSGSDDYTNSTDLRSAAGQKSSAAQDPKVAPAAGDEADDSAAEPAGKLTDELISKQVPRMGGVVTDAKGWVLYRFDKDKANPATSNCVDDCAKVWPPLLVEGTPELTGIDPDEVGSILREDGGRQVTIGNWPVYRYIGDKKAGTWKGQAVGGTWYVVTETGKKNLTCLPKGTPKAVKPPAEKASAEQSSGGSESDSGSNGY